MKIISPKLKNINLKLKRIKIYKKKKTFLLMKQFKLPNSKKNQLFFLVLIPKKFFFQIKMDFYLMLNQIKQKTNIQLLSFKKGFNNNILKFYLESSIYNYILNKNRLLILYNINLTSLNFIKFLNTFYLYLTTNFYLLYSFYNNYIITTKIYNYLFSIFNLNKTTITILQKRIILILKKIIRNLLFFFLQIINKLIFIFIFIFQKFNFQYLYLINETKKNIKFN